MPTARKRVTPIRPGAIRAEVDNSGRVAYLYDEASIAKIRPVIEDLIRKHGDFASHAGFRRLGAAAAIVAYGLEQDDAIDVELVVGPPLTDAELAVARWLTPQRASLELPSGRILLDSGDSLRAAFPEQATDEGATIVVPPGTYEVTLHRMHGDQMDADGLPRDRRRGRFDVVVLTPRVGAPAGRTPGWLPCVAEPVRVSWLKKYSVSENTVTGLIVASDPGTVSTNIDHVGLKAIGVRPGARVKCRVGSLEFTTTFDLAPPSRPMAPAGAWWAADPHTGTELLVIGNRALRKVKLHTAVSVTPAPGPARRAGTPRGEAPSVRGTKAFAFLLGNALPAIETTLDEEDLEVIGARSGDDLVLAFVDEEPKVPLRLHLFGDLTALREAASASSRLPAAAEQRLRGLVQKLARGHEVESVSAVTTVRLLGDIKRLRYPDGPATVPWGGLLVPCHSDPSWKVLAVAPLVVAPGAALLPPLYFLPPGGGGVVIRRA